MPKLRRTRPDTQLRQRAAVCTLVATLAALSLLASTGAMGPLETSIFELMYTMPDSLRWFALLATQFGNVWVCIGIIGLLFVLRKNPRLALVVFRNSLVAYMSVEFIKFFVGRPRPMLLLDNVISREIAVYGNGFPSGHTALATVLILTLLPHLPKYLRWLPIAWIGVVAWSRMYLGVHAPLDVVGGLLVGLLVVLLADYLPWPRRAKR